MTTGDPDKVGNSENAFNKQSTRENRQIAKKRLNFLCWVFLDLKIVEMVIPYINSWSAVILSLEDIYGKKNQLFDNSRGQSEVASY